MSEPKFAAVAVVGRPSSGKSSLVNRLCGGKVSIVSPVPQTTRNRVRGVATTPRGQLVLIDTPGLHDSRRKLNLALKGLVSSSLADVEIVLYVVDLSRRPGDEEQAIADLVSTFHGIRAVALNKADVAPGHRAEVEGFLAERGLRGEPVSALTGEGVEALRERLLDLAPPGEPAYPEDYYTDQEVEFRISEIIREKAMEQVRQELPHALYVEMADTERRGQGLWARAFVCVERESQKGILIGKGASRIREIRLASERELAGIFPYPVSLDLQVKVRPNWRHRDDVLRRLIQ
jgi:GTP-binding protein Era